MAHERAAAAARREAAAERFRPDRVDLLVVAESPPTALDRYFYFEDVRTQDSLFRYVAQAVLECEPTRENKSALLERLRRRGVFLIDLVVDPLDDRPLSVHVPGLVERVRQLEPRWIVIVKVDVFDAVYPSLEEAGLPVSSMRIPFPNAGQQKRFEEMFARALEERQRPVVR
jgi:hypothetical protein